MTSRRRSIKVGAVHRGNPEKKLVIWAKNPAVLHVEGLGGEKMRRILCGDVRTETWDWVILLVNCAGFGNVAPRQDIC